MANDWHDLTNLTDGSPIVVERVRLSDKDIAIEGSFELPPLAKLSAEDQVFVMVFVRSHGSIKEMERIFGISYPTVKNRLNRISSLFELLDTEPISSQSEVLELLESGEISADEAIEKMAR